MGLQSALNTSLNGLTLNETTIDVLGNNIANAGTNGFKGSRVLFTTQLSRTLSVGSRPTTVNAGTNPRQVGLGATTAEISRDFTQGSITNSTSPSDLAVQGDGFFIVNSADGNVYTRNGNFSLNSQSHLATPTGMRVQGYGVDENFDLITTELVDITIPLGEMNIAQQTSRVEIGGALFPTGEVATQGTMLRSMQMIDATTTDPIVGTSLLVDVQNLDGNSLFTNGEELSFAPRKGGRSLEPLTMQVTATTTIDDLVALMHDTLGIQTGGTIPDDVETGETPGISISADGEFVVVGNMGRVNDIGLTVGDLTSNGLSVPLSFTKEQSANGESAITDFVIFDSLGEPITMKLVSYLETRDGSSTTFRYMLESSDDSNRGVAVSNDTVEFDGQGRVVSGVSSTFSINRDLTAATSPMQVEIDFSNVSGISSAAAGSTLTLQYQDGSDPGTLSSFVIDETGVINGVFDNGIIRTLGQVVLARFSNPQGLLENGSGTFREGVSSGSPFLVTPGNFGSGTIRAGAIELSNTDIGRNLVDLIVAATNYRGNARVISSVQQLVDELLVLGR